MMLILMMKMMVMLVMMVVLMMVMVAMLVVLMSKDAVERYDLAAKCYRQALNCVKETPALGEREKASKTQEIQVTIVVLFATSLDKLAFAGVAEGAADEGDRERPW